MEFWLILLLANFGVGICVGLTGVAGFLLPIVYTGPLLMGTTQALALSFGAFVIAGILGAYNYSRGGNLDLSFGIKLSLGSLAGAILGVKLNLVIPEEQVKMIPFEKRTDGERGKRAGWRISDPGAFGRDPCTGIRDRRSLRHVRCRRPGAGDASFSPAGNFRADCGGGIPFQYDFYQPSGLFRLYVPVFSAGAYLCAGSCPALSRPGSMAGKSQCIPNQPGAAEKGNCGIFYFDRPVEIVFIMK